MRKQRIRGFTLIELMVVVAILGIMVAIVVPAVLRVVAKRRAQGDVSVNRSVAVAQEALKIQRVIKTSKGTRLLKRPLHAVKSSRVKVDLTVNYMLDRGKVVPVYEARYEGRYTLANSTRKSFSAQVYFPFPAGAGTFSDLQFLVSPRAKPTPKPTSRPIGKFKIASSLGLIAPAYDVRISPQGVWWRRSFAPGERVRVLIRYRVRGRERYRYRIAPGKKQRFHFVLSVKGVDPRIPPHALKPSSSKRMLDQEGRLYNWSFRDFLTTEDIEIRFPLEYSKYYRFALLGKLAGLSLLLFAFFFWFFGERQHPDKITRSNFALLNLGFVSFYPMFIYLDDHISMFGAMAIALATSVILTTAHTATFMGLRWALFKSLPLQLFFVVGFTFAVLFPTYRPLTFTIGGVILTALVIVIHARYQRERAREEEARKEAEEERKLREATSLRLSVEQDGVAVAEQSDSVALQLVAPPSEPAHNPAEEDHHCLFCGTSVSPTHKHCYDCGSLLHRTHQCSSCDFLYWYPSVETFRFCRQCGTGLYPPSSPLPALVAPVPENDSKS